MTNYTPDLMARETGSQIFLRLVRHLDDRLDGSTATTAECRLLFDILTTNNIPLFMPERAAAPGGPKPMVPYPVRVSDVKTG